jgi:hypothetical protein
MYGKRHKAQNGQCTINQNSKHLRLLENRMWEIQKGEQKEKPKTGRNFRRK